MKRALALAVASALIVAGCSGREAGDRSTVKRTAKIAVLLHLSGAEHRDWRDALDWAAANVNAAGGVAGRPIELEYRDVSSDRLDAAALDLSKDPDVVGVVGPQTSAEVFRVARTIIDSQTVLVAPSAASSDLYRAFHQSPFFWRTVGSDVAQVRALTGLAGAEGRRRVALLTSTDPYGTTFFDWFGFSADELGLRVTAAERWDQSRDACDRHVDVALRGHPQALVAVPTSVAVTECIVRRWREVGQGTELYFADAAEHEAVLDALGPAAEGIRGVAPEAPPANGFDAAFRTKFGHAPNPYAANAYDAVTLLAYGIEASHGRRGLALAHAMQDLVQGRGEKTAWDAGGVAAALAALRRGDRPDISGAAGPLTFDDQSYTEPVATTYRQWVVRDGHFATEATLTSTTDANDVAQAGLAAAHEHSGGTYQAGAHHSTWALLVAGSSGWENYRHQADVLAQYQLLRAKGVPDSHIVLVAANDLAQAPENPSPGKIRYGTGGPNVAENVRVDYHLQGLAASDVLDILAGRASAHLPEVIKSGPGDDVYVFMSGHGNGQGFYVGSNGDIAEATSEDEVITPDALAATARRDLQQRGRYGHLLIAVDACQGGKLGTLLDAPGAVLISGASPTEDSQSIDYDATLGTWQADEFASSLYRIGAKHPEYSLAEVFKTSYLTVHASHVSLYGPQFGSLRTTTFGDFLHP